MTAPRQVLAGTTYLVTRRCDRQEFLLRPSRLTNAIFLYVLAVAARRHRVRIHAFCVLSNHYHLVVTDPHARLPEFVRYLDGLVARAVNASLGRLDGFWDDRSFSGVALVEPADVVAKAAYTLANPCAAGLVRTGRSWPGLWSDPDRIGGAPLVAARPEVFFDPAGQLPERAELRLVAPAGFGSAAAFREQLRAALATLEARAERGRVAFVGARAVLRQKTTAKPRGARTFRELNPRVACRDERKRIEALGRLRDFLHAYQDALARWREGAAAAVFPAGTYHLRVLCGVACAAAG